MAKRKRARLDPMTLEVSGGQDNQKGSDVEAFSEPCVTLFGKEMEAWQFFKAAAQQLLEATNKLKQATAERERAASELLGSSHDAIVDAQTRAREAVQNERERSEIFRGAAGVFKDAITALSTAAAPPG